jgi:hypothetical protein
MGQRLHRVRKWILRGFLLLILLGALHVATLAFPFPAFAHKARFDEFAVYSDQPLPDHFDQVVEDVRTRIGSMEYARPGAACRVFICRSQRLYSLFAFLTRKNPNTLGIGLSAFGNIYLNETKIRSMAAHNYGGIRHSRFEGNFAEAIGHEIAHFNVVKKLGYRASLRMPVWKSEGYAEYQANIAATQADDTYDFMRRIDVLRNGAFWGSPIARRLFEWHLLVEFLAEVRGLGLIDLVDVAITEEAARQQMRTWYEQQRSSG